MFVRHSRAAVVVLSVLCLAAGAGGVAATDGDGSPDWQVETPSDENETQQEDPDSIDDGEYDQETAAWLARTMSERLESSSVAVSQGQYEKAREVLGDDYDRRLAQYVEVAGDSGSAEDSGSPDAFEDARQDQRNFTDQVQRYRQQYAAYQRARENGNKSRARNLAREMEQTASNINDSSRRLNRDFTTIENATSVNLSDGQAKINETRANVSTTQADVRAQTLVGTNLTVQAEERTASFADPGAISGQLRTENGSVVANTVVRLNVGNQTQRVRTDSNGEFEAVYRPRSAPLGQQSIEVEYLPAPDTVYLSGKGLFTIAVEQVIPNVTSEVTPSTAAYGSQLNASATVTVQSTSIEGIPVEFVIGETVVAEGTTGSNGTFAASARLPASVDNGNRELIARIPYEDRALAGVGSRAPLVVSETPTQLSVASSREADTALVRGRLRTEDGDPVANRPVSLQVGDGDIQTVETNESGFFETELTELPTNGESARITARYAEPDSNLGNATATATVAIGGGGGGPPVDASDDRDVLINDLLALLFGGSDSPDIGFGDSGISYEFLILIVGLTGFVVVTLLWFVVSRLRDTDEPQSTGETESGETSVPEPSVPESSAEIQDETFNERVQAYLNHGQYDAAAMLAYDAIHDQLVVENGLEESTTHWELLREIRDHDVPDEQASDIETIVEAFETAAFAPTSVDAANARAAVERARKLRSNGSDQSAR